MPWWDPDRPARPATASTARIPLPDPNDVRTRPDGTRYAVSRDGSTEWDVIEEGDGRRVFARPGDTSGLSIVARAQHAYAHVQRPRNPFAVPEPPNPEAHDLDGGYCYVCSARDWRNWAVAGWLLVAFALGLGAALLIHS